MSNLATLKKFEKGHKKLGGKKKGWKSVKTELEEMLSEMTTTKDGHKITYLQAMLKKALHKAVIEGDMRAVEFLIDRIEGKPKATLDLSVQELPKPIYGGKSK